MVMNSDLRQVGVLGGLGVRPALRLPGVGRRVLAYLAIHHSIADRTLMCGRLWPDLTESRARANLRRALWQLPPGWVVSAGGDLALDAEVDLDRARNAAESAMNAGHLDVEQVELLTRDLLPGWYDDWVMAEQEQFHLWRIQALEAVSRSSAETGDHALATRAALSAVCAEPLRESAVTALVEAHLNEGNLFEAVRRYQSYASLLKTELDVEPGQHLTGLVHDYRKRA